MNTNTLKYDFYLHIKRKLEEVDGLSTSNVSNQYLDEIPLNTISYPWCTVKTRLNMENVGNQLVTFRTGIVRLIIYDSNLTNLYGLYDKVINKLEENDDELYLVSWNDDEDMLNLDGTKPHYISVDIELNIYPKNN